MPAETEKELKKRPDNPNLDRLDDDADDGQEQKVDIAQLSIDFFVSHIKGILSTVILLLVIGILIVSNFVTMTLSVMATKKLIETKYQKREGIKTTNQYTGPLYYLHGGDYSMYSGTTPVYLRMHATIELDNRSVVDEVREKSSRIESIVREIVTNQQITDFSSRTGMQHARRLMLESINKILTSGKIADIYFTDYRFIWVKDQAE